jgi:pimeloyl-ACP methyl ester carboxylesterase
LTTPPNEFDLVAQEAAELGIDEPLALTRLEIGPMSALRWGEEPGDLVFLHGAGLNAHSWDSTALTLAEPALAVDLPGHGESSWREDANYSPTQLALDLANYLTEASTLGILRTPVVVAGQSLGGLAAIELAQRTDLISHVVLVDILPLERGAAGGVTDFLAGPAVFATREEIERRAVTFGYGGSRGSLARAVAHNTRGTPDGQVAWKHHLGALAAAGSPLLAEFATQTAWEQIARVGVPIDLIWASRTVTTPEARARFAALHPEARLVQIDAGHNIQEDAPTELAGALARLARA